MRPEPLLASCSPVVDQAGLAEEPVLLIRKASIGFEGWLRPIYERLSSSNVVKKIARVFRVMMPGL